MSYNAAGANAGHLPPRGCQVMLCRDPAISLVALNALDAGQPVRAEVPMCRPCSDQVELAIAAGRRPAITPDGQLYLDNLAELLRHRA